MITINNNIQYNELHSTVLIHLSGQFQSRKMFKSFQYQTKTFLCDTSI